MNEPEHAEDLDLEPADANSVVGGASLAEVEKSVESAVKSAAQKPAQPQPGMLKAPPKGL